jgi:hypothetical protein
MTARKREKGQLPCLRKMALSGTKFDEEAPVDNELRMCGSSSPQAKSRQIFLVSPNSI